MSINGPNQLQKTLLAKMESSKVQNSKISFAVGQFCYLEETPPFSRRIVFLQNQLCVSDMQAGMKNCCHSTKKHLLQINGATWRS